MNVPAAYHVLRIIQFLATQVTPVGATAIARELGLPRSSTYFLMKALQDEGFVLHFPEDRSFALSPSFSDLGSFSSRSYKWELLAKPLARKLIARVGVPVVAHIGILRGTEVVYVVKERSAAAPALVTRVGVRLPAHTTATGRAILSQLSPEQITAIYLSDAEPGAGGNLPTAAVRRLREQLAQARSRGWASEREEISADLGSISAAALDRGGLPVAAIGVTFRLSSVRDDGWDVLGEAVQISAQALEMRVQGKL